MKQNSDSQQVNIVGCQSGGAEFREYFSKLREFLSTFKVKPCTIENCNNHNLCPYHHQNDRRRNPYAAGHQFLYNPGPESNCTCSDKECPKAHTNSQRIYHPTLYRTKQCVNYYNCDLEFFCPYMHASDYAAFQYSEFFRFDIRTFKTLQCPRREQHDRKTCLYYHYAQDKRRAMSIEYSHFQCNKVGCNDQLCLYSHNKIEQLYHPSRYKTKFCQSYTKKNNQCQYRQFCSFAHTPAEITIELIHLETRDNAFYINSYKTVWCPFTENHDRPNCSYAHNFQDYRRKPSEYKYQPIKCEKWKSDVKIESIQESGCQNGMNCDKCHGWKEHSYHPLNYKRGKGDHNTAIEKKLNSSDRRKDKNSSQDKEKLKKVVDEMTKNNSYPKGTPFCPNERDISQSSRRTKAKTYYKDGSERSNDDSSNGCLIQGAKILEDAELKPFFYNEDSMIWRETPRFVQRIEEGRSKSEHKSDSHESNYYSNSIKDIFDETILRKLREMKMSEVKLKNLDKEGLRKLEVLKPEERDYILRKLQEYNLKQDLHTISYSKELTKFFIDKNCQQLLQKLQKKKIKEQKLLKLMPKSIREFSFLEETQKDQLPGLLKQFGNDREFNELNSDIARQVQDKSM